MFALSMMQLRITASVLWMRTRKETRYMKNLFSWICLLVVMSLACQMSAAVPAVTVPTIAPTPAPTSTLETDDGIIPPSIALRQYTVCAWTLYVRGGPGTGWRVLDVLERGEVVTVREWSHNGNGWAMIGTARWVNGDYLQKRDCQ